MELNANVPSSLYQEYCTKPGDVITWSVDHRGRAGTDVATVRIGGDLASAAVQETMSDSRFAWGSYSGTYTVPAGQTTTIIAFLSLIFSEIKPIIDFGWMMTMGLITSFIITFTLLPTLINFVPEGNISLDKYKESEITSFFSKISQNNQITIFIIELS